MGKRILGNERYCAVCGNEFQLRRGWLYKRMKKGKTYLMCSWSCLEAWDKRNRKYPVLDMRTRMVQAIRDGLSTGEIMVLLGESADRIERCRKRLEEEKRDPD